MSTLSVGTSPGGPDLGMYIASIVLCTVSLFYQLTTLQKMTILPVRILPFATICWIYENLLLALGSKISSSERSFFANLMYLAVCFEIPILFTVTFELAYRLYETRSAQFFCIRFDELDVENDRAKRTTATGALSFLWGMRLLAVGLFIVNVFVNWDLSRVDKVNQGGLIDLAKPGGSQNLALWLSLVPPIALGSFALVISISVIL